MQLFPSGVPACDGWSYSGTVRQNSPNTRSRSSSFPSMLKSLGVFLADRRVVARWQRGDALEDDGFVATHGGLEDEMPVDARASARHWQPSLSERCA